MDYLIDTRDHVEEVNSFEWAAQLLARAHKLLVSERLPEAHRDALNASELFYILKDGSRDAFSSYMESLRLLIVIDCRLQLDQEAFQYYARLCFAFRSSLLPDLPMTHRDFDNVLSAAFAIASRALSSREPELALARLQDPGIHELLGGDIAFFSLLRDSQHVLLARRWINFASRLYQILGQNREFSNLVMRIHSSLSLQYGTSKPLIFHQHRFFYKIAKHFSLSNDNENASLYYDAMMDSIVLNTTSGSIIDQIIDAGRFFFAIGQPEKAAAIAGRALEIMPPDEQNSGMLMARRRWVALDLLMTGRARLPRSYAD